MCWLDRDGVLHLRQAKKSAKQKHARWKVYSCHALASANKVMHVQVWQYFFVVVDSRFLDPVTSRSASAAKTPLLTTIQLLRHKQL
uniref:Uncharacterized protein n=1 Tax=Physcomitrium patens TaxID=3218 RepID=A0A2K1KBT7_PHYPA|nr:hypothetical protein PHYPA_010419 [Physcomitrium patens]